MAPIPMPKAPRGSSGDFPLPIKRSSTPGGSGDFPLPIKRGGNTPGGSGDFPLPINRGSGPVTQLPPVKVRGPNTPVTAQDNLNKISRGGSSGAASPALRLAQTRKRKANAGNSIADNVGGIGNRVPSGSTTRSNSGGPLSGNSAAGLRPTPGTSNNAATRRNKAKRAAMLNLAQKRG